MILVRSHEYDKSETSISVEAHDGEGKKSPASQNTDLIFQNNEKFSQNNGSVSPYFDLLSHGNVLVT